MTSPHTDLDLTDAVEAAAAAQWTQRVPSIPWEKVVATNPALAHGLREQVLPIVTAAAPIIAAALTRAHAEFDRWLAAHDAELRAEVERLRGVERGWQHDRAEWERERDEARRQAADLRAGIEALRRQWEGEVLTGHGARREGLRKALDDLADLAGSGEQPGECPECGDAMCRCGIDWTAPVVPDSAGLRERVLDAMGARWWSDNSGEVEPWDQLDDDERANVIENADLAPLADAVLAVVGQSVTAEPQVIPRYAMLDVWQALGHEPVEFEAWRDEHGYSEAWARLCAEVRERWACDHERAARDIARTTAATPEQARALVEALARGAKTLEEAWDEGYTAGNAIRFVGQPAPRREVNPYRAAVRPSGQEGS